MRKRFSALTWEWTAILLLLAACNSPFHANSCTDPLGCLEIPPGSPLVIGTLLATSGDYAPIGLDSQRGVELAVSEKGDLFGHEISFIHQSTDCTELNARLAATRLAAEPLLIAVIGPTCSEEALVAAPILSEAGLVVLSPSARAQVDVPGYFRTIYPANLQDPAVDFILNRLGATHIVVVKDGSLDAAEKTSLFEKLIQAALKSKPSSNLDIQALSSTDFQALLASVAIKRPDLIYLSVPPFPAGQLVAQIRSIPGLETVPILGDESLFSPEFFQSARESAKEVYLVGPDISHYSSRYPGFLITYQREYQEAPVSVYHAFAYDAVQILLDSIERSATQDQTGTLTIPRSALRRAVLDSRDIQGLTGGVSCSPNGNCYNSEISLAIYQILSPDEKIWQPGLNPKRIYP